MNRYFVDDCGALSLWIFVQFIAPPRRSHQVFVLTGIRDSPKASDKSLKPVAVAMDLKLSVVKFKREEWCGHSLI
jgi:hypothetical protein